MAAGQKALNAAKKAAKAANRRVARIKEEKETVTWVGGAGLAAYFVAEKTGQQIAKRQKEGKSLTIGKTAITYPTAIGAATFAYGALQLDDKPEVNMAAAILGVSIFSAERGATGYLQEMAAPPPAPGA